MRCDAMVDADEVPYGADPLGGGRRRALVAIWRAPVAVWCACGYGGEHISLAGAVSPVNVGLGCLRGVRVRFESWWARSRRCRLWLTCTESSSSSCRPAQRARRRTSPRFGRNAVARRRRGSSSEGEKTRRMYSPPKAVIHMGSHGRPLSLSRSRPATTSAQGRRECSLPASAPCTRRFVMHDA